MKSPVRFPAWAFFLLFYKAGKSFQAQTVNFNDIRMLASHRLSVVIDKVLGCQAELEETGKTRLSLNNKRAINRNGGGAESSPKLVEDSPILPSLHQALPMRKAGIQWSFADRLGKAFSEKPPMERSALSRKSAAIDGASG
jgi:hypothetical protein